MAAHDFGIMPFAPKEGTRYDEYEPYKYNCISVDDAYLEDIASSFDSIDFYWHTLDVPGKRLAYCGITLIPPSSMSDFLAIIEDIDELSNLKSIMQEAYREGKWIIHYGL